MVQELTMDLPADDVETIAVGAFKPLALPGMRLAGLDPAILIASAELPGSPLADPADRTICATARARSLAVMTRDQRMLAYGTAGHINVVPC
jgi:PIN domain nuclease of toxin-antitoxin system